MGLLQHKMKLCVPAIYDDFFIEEIIRTNNRLCHNEKCIYELYGSFPSDLVGNLRPPSSIRTIDRTQLKRIISQLHENGIQFDYIMNSTVLPVPLTAGYKKEVLEFVQFLSDMGVDSVTVTIPYLILLIKKYYPEMKVNVSICNEIASVKEAKEFDDLGADVIVLDRDVNRDFELLRQIRKQTDKELKVLCNSPCLYHCINVQYHAGYSSFLSGSSLKTNEQGDSEPHVPYCTFYCHLRSFADVSELIKAHWIRPEDMHYYSESGISLFKIDGRDKKSKYLLEVVNAYVQGRYQDNLFHLLKPEFAEKVEDIDCNNVGRAIGEEADEENLKKWTEEFMAEAASWNVGINSCELDGFLENFAKGKISCRGDCDNCHYCDSYAKKITIDKSWQDKLKQVMKYNLDRLL